MNYRKRVAVQGAVEVQDAEGGVGYTYETINGLDDLAATVLSAVNEARDSAFTVQEDMYDVIVGGDHPEIRPEMIVQDGEAVYDIVRVTQTLRRRMTILSARQVAI